MEIFQNEEEYLSFLRDHARLPEGFYASLCPLEFIPRELETDQPQKMNLSLILAEEATPDFGAVFTRNAFPGHPVVIGKELLNAPLCSGVIINNKISNVASPGGLEDSNIIRKKVQELSGVRGEIFPSSTGIIGWNLPVQSILEKIPALLEKKQKESLLPVARGIMTTDRYPKAFSVSLGEGRLTGICKGAGMIEPNMATMLSFLVTDVELPREELRILLKRAVDQTFNRISVDSDQSTSDTVLFLSSGKKPPVSSEEMYSALLEVCGKLSRELVRNGEGTAHVIKVTVTGAHDEQCALGLAKGLVNSPLTKTAIYGNDPNVGRFLQAAGDYLGNRDISLSMDSLEISLGGHIVFSEGQFQLNQKKEKILSAYLKDCAQSPQGICFPEHQRCVEIALRLNSGDGEAVVYGSDLSLEYIHENADYRS